MNEENKKDFIDYLSDAMNDKSLLFGISKITDETALKDYFENHGYLSIEEDALPKIANLLNTIRSRMAQGFDEDYY